MRCLYKFVQILYKLLKFNEFNIIDKSGGIFLNRMFNMIKIGKTLIISNIFI